MRSRARLRPAHVSGRGDFAPLSLMPCRRAGDAGVRPGLSRHPAAAPGRPDPRAVAAVLLPLDAGLDETPGRPDAAFRPVESDRARIQLERAVAGARRPDAEDVFRKQRRHSG